MRTLHELVPPFLQNNAGFQAHMAAVVASDALHHDTKASPTPATTHTDIASLLVNTLSNSAALAAKDSSEQNHQPTLSPSQASSRAASASEPHTPAPPDSAASMPSLDGVTRVTQQAQMAIRSILANANAQHKPDTSVWNMGNVAVPPPGADASRANGQPSSSKRRLEDDDDFDENDEVAKHAKIRRTVQEHVQRENDRVLNMTTVVCLHAAVAQKSYGSEKRFLCPPPMVRIEGPFGHIRDQKLSMCIVSEIGEKSIEAVQPLDPSLTASFKFLHVTGTAKAKSFNLQLQITPPQTPAPFLDDAERPRPWATFESAPVTIISKPSKKTAKTRNISSCILAGGPVSLFNRINSQTVRTKYMTIDNTHLCASNVSWSAFNVSVVRRPQDQAPIAGPQPVTYGSEIVLSDSATGITTAPLVIRKVDKGKISNEDGGPVSQMQKIALQRVNTDGTRNYLSAAGPVPGTPGVSAPPTPGVASQAGTHHLLFASPRSREETKDGVRTVIDEVDDYLCWTIVGISKFQYTFFDALGNNEKIPEVPITPFPTLFQPPVYRPNSNTLDLTVSSFFYQNPKTGSHSPLEIWVGDIGPLHHRIGNALPSGPLTNIASFYDPHGPPPLPTIPPESAGTVPGQSPLIPSTPAFVPTGPYHTNVIVDMPPVQDIVKVLLQEAHRQQRIAAENADSAGEGEDQPGSPPVNITGRSLPLLFIRGSDGVGYHSGRTITAENVFQGIDLNNPPTGPGGPDPTWVAAAQAAAADGGHYGWSIRVL